MTDRKKIIAVSPETRPAHYTFGARRFDRKAAEEEFELFMQGNDLTDGETYETAMDARREALGQQRRIKRIMSESNEEYDVTPGTRIYRDATGYTWRVVGVPLGSFD